MTTPKPGETLDSVIDEMVNKFMAEVLPEKDDLSELLLSLVLIEEQNATGRKWYFKKKSGCS